MIPVERWELETVGTNEPGTCKDKTQNSTKKIEKKVAALSCAPNLGTLIWNTSVYLPA